MCASVSDLITTTPQSSSSSISSKENTNTRRPLPEIYWINVLCNWQFRRYVYCSFTLCEFILPVTIATNESSSIIDFLPRIRLVGCLAGRRTERTLQTYRTYEWMWKVHRIAIVPVRWFSFLIPIFTQCPLTHLCGGMNIRFVALTQTAHITCPPTTQLLLHLHLQSNPHIAFMSRILIHVFRSFDKSDREWESGTRAFLCWTETWIGT